MCYNEHMENGQPCVCGCGMQVTEGKSYVRGHGSRMASYREARIAKRMKIKPANPSGLCMCGCGEPAPRATTDKFHRGYRKGDFVRYIPGHHVKTGAENPHWKGGRTIRWGYAYVMVPGHPYGDKDDYVAEHRLVAGHTFGRILQPHEHVHHINRNRLDNRPENLAVMSKLEHHLEHRDVINNWRATLTPDELRAHFQNAGKAGGAAAKAARLLRKSISTKPPTP